MRESLHTDVWLYVAGLLMVVAGVLACIIVLSFALTGDSEQLNGWPASAEFERLTSGAARWSAHDTGITGLTVVVDHQTGVEYAVYRGDFTPLVDADGSPLRVLEAG